MSGGILVACRFFGKTKDFLSRGVQRPRREEVEDLPDVPDPTSRNHSVTSPSAA
jgi:hypothetical protein